jgi:hypothetical protein
MTGPWLIIVVDGHGCGDAAFEAVLKGALHGLVFCDLAGSP